MATVDLTQTGTATGHPSPRGVKLPYLVEVYVTGAAAAAAKGSALAAADVIQVLDIPAETIVLSAGIEVLTADTASSADVLADLGITGGDVDGFTDGADLSTVGYPAFGTGGDIITNAVRQVTADTLDILTGATTTYTSNDDWKIRVYAVLLDISSQPEPQAAKDVS